MQVVIIEDEKKAARHLVNILKEIDDTINILTVIESVERGVEWFRKHKVPDLIFSDIQLSDGVSFLIFQEVRVNAPIIFCTAFDEYLMEAFDTNAISYLLKPINREQINAALDKYSSMQEVFQAKTPLEKVGTLISQLNYQYKSSLLINYGDKIIPIKMENIACFYWEETRLLIITGDNQQFYYNSSLDEIQKQLNPDLFYRGNRQFIINRTFVTGAERYFTRRLIAKLSVETPEKIIISKEKSSAFLEWLSNQP